MTRNCPSCGAETVSDARFCRRCGAPLRQDGGGHEPVSPQSPTVPLRDEGRTTDGLASEDPRGAAPETTRVSRADLDSILQRAARDVDPDATAFNQPASQPLPDTNSPAPPSSHAPSSSSPLSSAPLSEEDLMKTRASIPEEYDEEVTVISSRPFTGEVRPMHVQPVPATGELPPTLPPTEPVVVAAPSQPTPPVVAAAAPRKRGPWLVIGVIGVVLLLLAGVGALFAFIYLRKGPTETTNVQPTAPVAADQRQLAEEKVVEAEAMLASGDLNGALNLLREAVRTDPNNARAHRRLGDILLETGARRDAIEELRAVTRLEPNDFTAWRVLASAQLAEGLPADAVESYKRLVALTAESDQNDLLAYADALRLAGRAEEAQALYQRLSTSPDAGVAASARQHLAELTAATTAPTPVRDTRPTTDANTSNGTQVPPDTVPTPAPPQATPIPTPVPTPPPVELTPAERYERGVRLWGANRSAAITEFLAAARGGNPDASYYLGLDIVEGKDMSTLKRAEVVAALTYFQRAQAGRNGAQARRYAQQLEKEYDRIRNQR